MDKASIGKRVPPKITIESIAELWVNLVLGQVLAKKLPHKELIKIKNINEYQPASSI